MFMQELLKNEISALLNFTVKTHLPIYKQLEEGIRKWLLTKDIGFKLPPERQIALHLNLDRATIRRAIQPLVKEGVLVRRYKRGTLYVKSVQERPHPLNDSFYFNAPSFRKSACNMVNLASFENLSHQEFVWQKMAQLFNKQSSNVVLKIVQVPYSVNNVDSYWNYIKEVKPGAILLNYHLACEMKARGFLVPIPEKILLNFLKRKYFSSLCGLRQMNILDFSLPVHFSPYAMIINRDLCKSPILKKEMTIVDFVESIPFIIKKDLSKGIDLIANAWELPLFLGIKPEPDTLFLKEFCMRAIKLMCTLIKYNFHLVLDNSNADLQIKKFIRGEALSYIGYLGKILGHIKNIRFPIQSVAIVPFFKKTYFSTGATFVGVPVTCENKEQAFETVAFLLENEAQKIIAEDLLNASFLREANTFFANAIGMDEKGFLHSLNSMYFYTAFNFNLGDFIIWGLMPLCRDILKGKLDMRNAVKQLLHAYSEGIKK
jgi:DNA-binding transcriptional regulator YhcF (GntR family)